MSGRAWTVRAGFILLAVIGAAAIFAPFLAPNSPIEQFQDRAYAPPMRVHFTGSDGLRRPHVMHQVLVDRVNRSFREDPEKRVDLRFFSDGHLVTVPPGEAPLLLLGADSLGRDLFARVLFGARRSLGVAVIAVTGALLIGCLVGGVAGVLGGRAESSLMWFSDFLLALPGAYLVLILRGLMSQAPSETEVFLLLTSLLALTAWPHAARGVRAIVAVERSRDYAEAARASGAGTWRLLRHLLPAARGFLAVEVVVLVPALLVAEATVSYLGLGFSPASPSWGTLLQDAANVKLMSQAPWVLAPAACLFTVTLGVHLLRPADV